MSDRPPEYLEAGAIYTSKEFMARLRLGQAGWRKLKREGLKTHKLGPGQLPLFSDYPVN